MAPPCGPGREYALSPDEMVFSRTDARGVITAVNTDLVQVSGYRAEELVGTPHSILRHPGMPAGVYRLIWQRLHKGLPTAAYVIDRAKDGTAYRSFASYTPLGEEHVCVRSAPIGPYCEQVWALYDDLVGFERDLAWRQHLPRPTVAAASADELERRLADLSFTDYDDFVAAALPDEVLTRGRPETPVGPRPATGDRIEQILDAAASLDGELHPQLHRLDGYRNLTLQLGPATEAVIGQALALQRAVAAALASTQDVTDHVPALTNIARVMDQPMSLAVTSLEQIDTGLIALRRQVADLTLRVALARHHAEMIVALAVEVLNGRTTASFLTEILRLCTAVDAGTEAMVATVDDVNRTLGSLDGRIAQAGELMQDFGAFLGQWRLLVLRRRQYAGVAAHLGPIDDGLDGVTSALARLDALAAGCRDAETTLDRRPIQAPLQSIRAAAGHSSGVLSPAGAQELALARAQARARVPMPIWG